MSKRLTGRRRYRTSSTGMIVLQVEVEDEGVRGLYNEPGTGSREWRDATVEDITLHQTVNPKEEATVEQVYDETRGDWL